MVKFNKNVKKLLPYDRKQYVEFLDDDFSSSVKWYGVSLQLPGAREGKVIGVTTFIEYYKPLVKEVILKFESNSLWIVNHDEKDWEWFPNDEDNTTPLRSLFKQNQILNSFKGGLTFATDDLSKYIADLISYPYTVFDEDDMLYSSLDISHSQLPFIIKTDAHWGIDLLSTDRNLLKEITIVKTFNTFILQPYRGTSI